MSKGKLLYDGIITFQSNKQGIFDSYVVLIINEVFNLHL